MARERKAPERLVEQEVEPVKKRPAAKKKKAPKDKAAPAKKEITKKGKKKDPNAPKKALSAYMIFASENRSTVMKKNPDAKFTDIGRILGEMWREMSDAKKKPYNDKSAKDKKRYEKEMAKYKA